MTEMLKERVIMRGEEEGGWRDASQKRFKIDVISERRTTSFRRRREEMAVQFGTAGQKENVKQHGRLPSRRLRGEGKNAV